MLRVRLLALRRARLWRFALRIVLPMQPLMRPLAPPMLLQMQPLALQTWLPMRPPTLAPLPRPQAKPRQTLRRRLPD